MVCMAKVFKAGTISVGGDKIRLTSKGTGEFAFTDASNSDLFSTAIHDSEVSSLAAHQNLDTLQRGSDISSLDIVKDSEVSSLAKVQNTDTLQRSSDISSLDIVKDSEVSSLAKVQNTDTLQRSSDISSLDIVKDSEVSSLNSAIDSLDNALQVKTFDVSNNVESQTISWADGTGSSGSGEGFDSTAGAGDHGFGANTTVMVMTKAASGVALIAVQLVSIDANGFTVEFSESTGTGEKYDLVVMASN